MRGSYTDKESELSEVEKFDIESARRKIMPRQKMCPSSSLHQTLLQQCEKPQIES